MEVSYKDLKPLPMKVDFSVLFLIKIWSHDEIFHIKGVKTLFLKNFLATDFIFLWLPQQEKCFLITSRYWSAISLHFELFCCLCCSERSSCLISRGGRGNFRVGHSDWRWSAATILAHNHVELTWWQKCYYLCYQYSIYIYAVCVCLSRGLCDVLACGKGGGATGGCGGGLPEGAAGGPERSAGESVWSTASGQRLEPPTGASRSTCRSVWDFVHLEADLCDNNNDNSASIYGAWKSNIKVIMLTSEKDKNI